MASSTSVGVDVCAAGALVVRVGVVGAGVIAKRLARPLVHSTLMMSGPSVSSAGPAASSKGKRRPAAHDGAASSALVAVCDAHEPAALALARRYSSPHRPVTVFRDYTALCDADDVDLIYVAVPPSLHAEVVLRALDRGKHVLCEKPLALTDEETDAMVRAAHASGKVCAVNMPFRYANTMHKFQEMLAKGFVGQPRRVELTFRFPQWPRAWQRSAWVAGAKEGGPLREVGTHFFFALLELFPSDPPKRVQAQVKFPGEGKSETSGWGTIELESGLTCTVDLETDVAAPEENSITVLGDKGMLTLVDWCYLKGRTMTQALRGDSELVTYANDENVDCSQAVVEDVLRAIIQGSSNSSIVTFETARLANRILNALYSSNGTWIRL